MYIYIFHSCLSIYAHTICIHTHMFTHLYLLPICKRIHMNIFIPDYLSSNKSNHYNYICICIFTYYSPIFNTCAHKFK